MSQCLALLALGGSLTTMVGCSAIPLMDVSDDPSFVVAMVVEPPAGGNTNPELPLPPPSKMPADRRSETPPLQPNSEETGSSEPAPAPLPNRQLDNATMVESEVVGWRLNGSRSWQTLNVLDMEVIADDQGQRFLPVLRILRILDIEHRIENDIASYQLPGESPIRIDLATASAWIGNSQHPLQLQPGKSDITGRPEIFVAIGDLQLLLPIQFAWDDINYEFKSTTQQVFAVWERRDTEHGMLFANANLVGMDLPNLLDTAEPAEHKLSFMEVQWNSRLSAGGNRDGELTIGTAPTVWGNVFGGRYKVAISNTEMSFGPSSSSDTGSDFVPSHIAWTRSNPTSEVVVGDSSFGLHDFAFPITRYTGIRFNGLLGSSDAELENDVSSRGLHRRFYRPHVFEGYAPVGSEVRLEMNGNIIATQRVLEETDPIAGTGIFRFEDIALATNSLSNVRAVITDLDGVETEVERDLIGAPQMLPAGRLSYVGGLGTSRSGREWDTSGSLLATRVLYGLTDKLSIGASLAMQSQFFDLTGSTDGNDRAYPGSSRHAVAELSSLPLTNLTVSGDVAISAGSDDSTDPSEFDGTAYRVRARYYPANELQFGTQFFNYAPGYFDGRNRELENKMGYSVDGQWRPTPKWAVRAAVGAVDQIESRRLYFDARTADYRQLQVSTSALPRTNLTFSLDQNDLSWEKPKTLAGIRSRTRFRGGVNLRIDAAFGDQLSPDGDQDYFQGLTLPGLRRIGSDNRYFALDKQLNSIHRLGLEFRNTGTIEKLSAVHAFETPRLRMSSKLGYDMKNDQPVWEGWWDLPFKERGRDRLSLITRYERGEWRADLAMNLVSLFENDNGGFGRVPGDRFYADRGGVKGRVFVDINGNGVLDAGEHGVPDIEVFGEHHVKTRTDIDGKFYLPVASSDSSMQVALNVDTVPATYSIIHGKQTADVGPGGATEVNLAIMPMVTVTGSILLQAAQPDETAIAEYREIVAALPDLDLTIVPEMEYSKDDVVVLSRATRISPSRIDTDIATSFELPSAPPGTRLADVLPRAKFPLAPVVATELAQVSFAVLPKETPTKVVESAAPIYQPPVVLAESTQPAGAVTEPALPEIVELIRIERPSMAETDTSTRTFAVQAMPEMTRSFTDEDWLVQDSNETAVPWEIVPEVVASGTTPEPVLAQRTSPPVAAPLIAPDDEFAEIVELIRIEPVTIDQHGQRIHVEQETFVDVGESMPVEQPVLVHGRPETTVPWATVPEVIESITVDKPASSDESQRAQLRMSRAMAQGEPAAVADLKLSRTLEQTTVSETSDVPTPATEPVALRMAPTIQTHNTLQTDGLSPLERAIVLAKAQEARAQETRASGMKLSRELSLQRHKLQKKAISGVRVIMRDSDNQVVADSFTASDGSFYLSHLTPGSYRLEVDPKSIPEGYIVLEMSKTIEILQGQDFQEIELPPIYAVADLENSVLR